MTVQPVAQSFAQLRACDANGAASVATDALGSGADHAPSQAAAVDSTVVTLRHVVVNATSVTYQHLAPRAARGSRAAESTAAASGGSARVDAPSSNGPTVTRLDSNDFAALRARSIDLGEQVALALDLTTRDGDSIRLDFSQIDTFERTWFGGETAAGGGLRATSTTASSRRYVDVRVTGDLSDDEKSAIDAVLQNVIDVANPFFHGDLQSAVARLADMDIDTNQLADVSLKMSTSRSRQAGSVAIGGAAARVRQAAQASTGVGRTLGFLADQQKQLIAAAKTRLDDRSAVRLVTQLLPVMIAPPSTEPSNPAAEASSDAPVVTDSLQPAATAA